MPDFLHKDTAHESGASHTSPPAAHAHEPASDTSNVMPSLRRSSATPQAPNDGGEGPGAVIKKPPSRVWTDHYGAVFLLIAAVFIGTGSFILRPLVIDYRRLAGTINSTATLIGDERGYLQSVKASISAAQSIPSETLENVDEALPRDANIPKMLQAVALFAQKQNVTLQAVQFTAPSVGGGGIVSREPLPIDIGITVTVNGYAGLRQFLDGVERSLRVFDLGGISVTAGNVGQSAETANASSYSFRIRTYFLPPPSNTDT